jgi:hypothetical protein
MGGQNPKRRKFAKANFSQSQQKFNSFLKEKIIARPP